VLKYIQQRQIITAQGQLSLEHYSNEKNDKMLRLDFATILDYGKTPEEKTETIKGNFVNMDITNVKKVAKEAREKATIK
jgi:hypothetical protein